jgi:hypothetical protein
MSVLNSAEKLMPILSAVHHHTRNGPAIVEPEPQFMADFVAKQIANVAELYGDANYHRTSFEQIRSGDM